ncbi:ATP-dependent DNA helicase PIF1-like protein [Tanacetum coccineum]
MAEYYQKWHNGTSRTRSIETSDGLTAIQAQLNNLGREIKKVNEKERGFGSSPSSTETNQRDHVKLISTTIEADMTLRRRIGSSQYAVSAQQNRKLIFESRQATIPFLIHLNNYCYDEKGSYGPQYLDTCSYGATHLNDALPRKEKDLGSFTLPCYINSFCFKKAFADLGASVSVMPLSTYINLGLGELAHTKLTIKLANRTVKHPKGIAKNVLVGIVVEDMDPYLDKGMTDVIVGEPFCKASCVEAIRFDGIITIHDGDDSVTYQMVRANPRFKHLTNEQCNKIPPLLKDPSLSEMRRWKNGSHTGTLAWIRWNKEAEKKSNLKT